MQQRHDIYANITAQLITAIEAGAGSWRMPWHHDGAPIMRPTSAAGRRYSGINRVVLWAVADALGYTSGTWATYQQWKAAGGQVRKGETGTHVILWKTIDRQGDEASAIGEEEQSGSRARCFARAFCVFNRDQVDGVNPQTVKDVAPIETSVSSALGFLEGLGVAIDYGLYDAHYRPDLDRIFMPERSAFINDASMVSTLAHEVGHAAGHVSRLARETLRDYAKDRATRGREELVAELTAAMIMADLGLACTPRPDHAAYLSSWLTTLRHDPRAIFTAAAQAQASADWMHAEHERRQAMPIAA